MELNKVWCFDPRHVSGSCPPECPGCSVDCESRFRGENYDLSVDVSSADSDVVPTTLVDFLGSNAGAFSGDEIAAVVALKIDGEVTFGGGAAPLFVVRRVS